MTPTLLHAVTRRRGDVGSEVNRGWRRGRVCHYNSLGHYYPRRIGASAACRAALKPRGTRPTMVERIVYNLLQVFVVLAFAPLVEGVLGRLKENLHSKRGPSVFQPYRDLWKLFHKDEIVSEDSSWVFRFSPHGVRRSDFCGDADSGADQLPVVLCFYGGHVGGWVCAFSRRVLRHAGGGRYRQPLRPHRREPDAHGGFPGRTGLHDRVFHGFFCGRFDHPLHRSAEMGNAPGELFHALARAAGAGVSDADPGRGRAHPRGQPDRPFRVGHD